MSSMLRDFKQSVRALLRRPGMPLLMILTLAVGIGANTAIFNMINALILRPLPFDDPGSLVALHETQRSRGADWDPISAPNLRDWRRGVDVFADLGAFSRTHYNLGFDDRPEWLEAARVESSLFPTLGVPPIAGRGFTADEDRPGGAPVVLLSHALWQRLFSGDPGAIGRTLRLDGEVHEIVGVMPEGFAFPESAKLWTPLGLDPDARTRDDRFLNALARLAPGVSVADAQSSLDRVAADLERQFPGTNRGRGAKVRLLADELMPREARGGLILMLGAAAFVLLLICANLVSLLSVRVMARWREYALRASLGARRWELVRQLLFESVIIAVAGGLLAVATSYLAVRLMLGAIPVTIPFWVQLGLDARVLIFTLGLATVTGILFGLIPALRVTAPRAMAQLPEASRGSSSGKASQRLRNVLVVAELAVCGVLLTCSILLATSFYEMRNADRGYEAENRLTAQMSLTGDRYRAEGARQRFAERLSEDVAALPGVLSADVVDYLPTGRYGYRSVQITPQDRPVEPGEEVVASRSAVLPTYFDTLGIAVRSGRSFRADEVAEGREVAVISAGLADELWPGADPLGRRLRFAGGGGERSAPWLQVIGVVDDTEQAYRMGGLDQWPERQVYVPFGHATEPTVTLVVHTRTEPLSQVSSVKSVVASLDPDLPVFNVFSLEQVQRQFEWLPRFWTQMFSVFALFGLAISAIGLYGLISFSSAQRQREYGIRLALGAVPSKLVMLPVRQGLRLAAVGLAVGLVLAFLVARLMASVLFGVDPLDPLVYGGVAAVILLTAVVASLVPAMRILGFDPNTALRAE